MTVASKDISVPHDPAWLDEVVSGKIASSQFLAFQDFALQATMRDSGVLFVTFDNLGNARETQRMRDPWGFRLAQKSGWSHLGVLSYRPNWYRSAELFAQLDRLAGEGMFRNHDKVVFSGASMGGYGACAFSALAPGSEVITFSAQSTLAGDLAGWDQRYPVGTNADWSGPYADAAQSIHQAARLWLVYDPLVPEDLRHAQRLDSPHSFHLKARHAGHKSAWLLRNAGILGTLTREVVAGTMSTLRFYQLYRQARQLRAYEMAIIQQVIRRGGTRSMHRLPGIMRARNRPSLAHDIETRLRQAG